MKRRSLFFIGLASAIITITSLNYAFGSRWNGYNRYQHCHNRFNERDGKKYNQQLNADTLKSNY